MAFKVISTPHRQKLALLQNRYMYLALELIRWYGVSSGKGTSDLVHGMKGACIGVVHLQQQPAN
jgi:hypothetical protein